WLPPRTDTPSRDTSSLSRRRLLLTGVDFLPALPHLPGGGRARRTQLLNRDRGHEVAERRRLFQGGARCQGTGNAGTGAVAGPNHVDRPRHRIGRHPHRLDRFSPTRFRDTDTACPASTEDRSPGPPGQVARPHAGIIPVTADSPLTLCLVGFEPDR